MSLPNEFLECAGKARQLVSKLPDSLPDAAVSDHTHDESMSRPEHYLNISNLSPRLGKLRLEARSALDSCGTSDPLQLSDMNASHSETGLLHAAASIEHGSSLNQGSRRSSLERNETAILHEKAKSATCWENFELLDETIPHSISDITRELDEFYDTKCTDIDRTEYSDYANLDIESEERTQSQSTISHASPRTSSFPSPPAGEPDSATCISIPRADLPGSTCSESPVAENYFDEYAAQYPQKTPSFEVNVAPSHEYFSPKRSLCWDDRDFQMQWIRDKPYNLSNRPFPRSLVIGILGSELKAETPPFEAASRDEEVGSQNAKELKPVQIPGQSTSPQVKSSSQSNPEPTLISAEGTPDRVVESLRASNVSSQMSIEHEQIHETHKIDAEYACAQQKHCDIRPPSQEQRLASDKNDKRSDQRVTSSLIQSCMKDRADASVPTEAVHKPGSQQPVVGDEEQAPSTPVRVDPNLPVAASTTNEVDLDNKNDANSYTFPVNAGYSTAKIDNIQFVDVPNAAEAEEISPDDEVSLVTPIPSQPYLPPRSATGLHYPYYTPELHVPQTPLRPEGPALNHVHLEVTTPCPTPPLKNSHVRQSEKPVKTSKLLSPAALHKKGVKGVFSSPQIVPPPTSTAHAKIFNDATFISSQANIESTAAGTETDGAIGGSPMRSDGPEVEDESKEVATAVIVNSSPAPPSPLQQQKMLSQQPKLTETQQTQLKKPKARKSEVEKLLATRFMEVKPLPSRAIRPADKPVMDTKVKTRRRATESAGTVIEPSVTPTKSVPAKKRTRKVSLDAVTPKTPEKKLRRSGRRSGMGDEPV